MSIEFQRKLTELSNISKIENICLNKYWEMCESDEKGVIFETGFCPLLFASCFRFKVMEITPGSGDWGTDIVLSLEKSQMKYLKDNFNSIFGKLKFYDYNKPKLFFFVQAKCQKSPVSGSQLVSFFGGWPRYSKKYKDISGFIGITIDKFSNELKKMDNTRITYINGDDICNIIIGNPVPFYLFFISHEYHKKGKKVWKLRSKTIHREIIEKCSTQNKNDIECPECGHLVKVHKIKKHIEMHENVKELIDKRSAQNKSTIKCPECGHLVKIDNFKKHMESHMSDRKRECYICNNSIDYYEYPEHLKDCLNNYKKKKRKEFNSIGTIVCPLCPKKFKNLKELDEHFYYEHSYGSIKRNGSINESYYST